jgi:predicted Rossmann fold nucleotide-binding protein DprA/Smf involved in DNA uptake
MMNERSTAIAVLCSHLCVGEGVTPLEPKEYSSFATLLRSKKIDPEDILRFGKQDFVQQLDMTEIQADRFLRLLDRSASLSFEISKYESMGITVLTRADAAYPKKLKEKLGNACPPLFYAAGDPTIAAQSAIGFVGSRSIGESDILFTQSAVRNVLNNGHIIVSGGAKGCDSIAEETALDAGGAAIASLSDSMMRKLRNAKTLQAVQHGKLLLLSVVKPDAGFNTGVAMMRNRYIYAQSEATVVVKSDFNKGGTWNGATENLKNQWALTLCRNHLSYPGNKALIEKGAIPVEDDWDGSIQAFTAKEKQESVQQLSLFGDVE